MADAMTEAIRGGKPAAVRAAVKLLALMAAANQ
jgi:hypothetical protein